MKPTEPRWSAEAIAAYPPSADGITYGVSQVNALRTGFDAGRSSREYADSKPVEPQLPTDVGAVIFWETEHWNGLAELEKDDQWLHNGDTYTSDELIRLIDGHEFERLYSESEVREVVELLGKVYSEGISTFSKSYVEKFAAKIRAGEL